LTFGQPKVVDEFLRLKLKIPQIPLNATRSPNVAQHNVAQTIMIQVANCHARTVAVKDNTITKSRNGGVV
jgi:hypothetical protein